MSYILDALRKSEQQRQSSQPGSVTERVLINQPLPQQGKRKWWMLLIIVNLLALTGLFWYLAQKKSQPVPQIPVTAPVKTISQTPQAPVAVAQAKAPLVSPTTEKLEEAPSIAEMMSSQETLKTEPLPKKLNTEKKPVPVKKLPVKRSSHQMSANTEYEDDSMTQTQPEFLPPSQMPELPSDIPAKKGKLTINVFSYAQQPEERFVIINMTKYKVGQQIDGETKLKEIHPDHIVLQQGNAVFKMNRP